MKSLSEIVAENEHVAVDAIVDSLDRASVTFPAVEVGRGHSLHVFQAEYLSRDWEVWLNTEVADFDGLCIGSAATREAAVAAAVEVLETALALLQRPPQ